MDNCEKAVKRCEAIQCSDQKQCARCGLAWDVNDPDRPACISIAKTTLKKLSLLLEK
jgi:hypothetical protein